MSKKNWSSGADRLADTAHAAGFAMATPDDRPDDAPASVPSTALVTQPGGWQSATPTRALVVATPRAQGLQTSLREWMASLTWRAPA